MTTAAIPATATETGGKGLKRNAIGYLSNLVIGVASTAPAYSLAVTLGFIVAIPHMGTHAPAILLVSFLPILLIAFGYKYLNRADPDCGTTFAWTTRALGPWVGWLNGWAIFVADVIVMASLAVIASTYTFLLFNWSSAAHSETAVLTGSALWIIVMTWICYRGIELSARIQQFLLGAEILVLGAFAIAALYQVYVHHPAHSMHVSADWFNPFALGVNPLFDGVLLGIFIYWGWDSGVSVNEETESAAEAPGKAAVFSTLILLLIYLLVAAAAQAYAGTAFLAAPGNQNEVLSVLGTKIFGSPWDKLLIVAVLTSASASTQTTILPTARTTLSMARFGAIPSVFGRIHAKYLTPSVSTLGMGAVSILFTLLLVGFDFKSQSVLSDSVSAIGFSILFYYGFTGIACAVYFRKQLTRDLRTFIAVGVLPLVGAVLMAAVFVKAFIDYSKAGFNYSSPVLGIELPIFIGIGGLLLGVPLMALAALKYREFFGRKPEVAADDALDVKTEHVALHF
jgi:amino acid transporter